MKKLVLIFLLLTNIGLSNASELDSLKLLLNTNISDTTRIDINHQIAKFYFISNLDSSISYVKKALSLAILRQRDKEIIYSYTILGDAHLNKGNYDSSLYYFGKSIAYSSQILQETPMDTIHKRNIALSYYYYGIIYFQLKDYSKALNSFFYSKKIAEEIKADDVLGTCYSGFTLLYEEIGENDLAIKYIYKAVEIAKRTNNDYLLIQSDYNLSTLYQDEEKYDSAMLYIKKCILQDSIRGELFSLASDYEFLADILLNIGEYESAEFYVRRTLSLMDKIGSSSQNGRSYLMIGIIYYKKGWYNKAIQQLKKSEEIADSKSDVHLKKDVYLILSKLFSEKKDYQNADMYFTKMKAIYDSIASIESEQMLTNFETKRKIEKREKKIEFLQKETELNEARAKKSSLIFTSFIIILLLILLVMYFVYRTKKHKHQIQKQRILKEAEKDILEATIKTENQERKRFAEDLHDGLGALLSALRLYVNELSDAEIDKEERKELLLFSNQLLNDALSNVENISNLLMPVNLKKNGLVVAVESYCNKIEAAGTTKIDLEFTNFASHYPEKIEIALYRVLTELINNSLKHAQARKISIHFQETNNIIRIEYRDDGKGFNYEEVLQSDKKGMGLENMKNRMNTIGGSCKIISKEMKGFYATLELDKNK